MSGHETQTRNPIPMSHKLAYSAFMLVAFCVVIELACFIAIKSRGHAPRPFLTRFTPTSVSGLEPKVARHATGQDAGTIKISYLDPHLGYAHDPKTLPELARLPGFAAYGQAAGPGTLRIVALGGSTTDPVVLDENWPKQLHDILSEKGIACEVLNGGVGGYTSSQELFKLLRDVLPLRPDIVICLNGVNEVGFGHSVKNHPMVHEHQRRLLAAASDPAQADPLFMPNTAYLIRRLLRRPVAGVNFGPSVSAEPVEQWQRNVRSMHAVCSEFGIDYVCFLQPILGFGDYQPSHIEQQMLQKKGQAYAADVRAFYEPAVLAGQNHPFITDFTGVLADQSDLYLDPRHLNEQGNRVIAEAIVRELGNRGFLRKP